MMRNVVMAVEGKLRESGDLQRPLHPLDGRSISGRAGILSVFCTHGRRPASRKPPDDRLAHESMQKSALIWHQCRSFKQCS